MTEEKNLYIFAGVNGAGKSTLYNSNIVTNLEKIFNNSVRINTDEIVRTFGDWKNEADQIKAARIAIKLRNECFKEGKSFNEETTLTGKSILKVIDKAEQLKYKIHLFYVSVDNPEIAKERIKNRVKKGGHHIPDKVVEKRYYESIENLQKIINKCDVIKIFDNTQIYKKICLINKEKKIFYFSKDIPEWSKKIINKLKLENKKVNKNIKIPKKTKEKDKGNER
ncbi:MAG: zeta toxin family protein [Fusobacterium sp.]|nr:zeta toxin family protein [Fusobacterium sp.]